MEQYIEDKCLKTTGMDMASKYGQMEQSTKVIGKKTKLMVEESFGMPMGMCLMENGEKIKLMVMEFTLM